MRIPFVPKNVMVQRDRFDFIQQYRGGGFMLIAGSIYWLLAFALTYVLNETILIKFYIGGGLLVPFLGILFYKLMKMKANPSQYSSLVGFASAITGCCFPVLLLVNELDSTKILPIICIINATHLIILCWIHLEYLYFIMVMMGVCLGMSFIYSIPSEYVHFICLIWGLISLIFGVIIHINSKIPLKGYDYQIINEKVNGI
ncbi:hypothetical protein ACZ11_09815 [Lysinibacillus xylanilyticus]|uniref:Uncharacterized protein n=1 Tax=Lysinibacillus xylanilyticus TaxID=582475 RepID=A0A0K9FCV6_9BACI|nr:hypothetical protein [Lysinibacillus xylanilyticus]KMY32414.1 hypothetical protein ACZ11_09815 [Lysinibacillus xylanilyticus]